MKKKNRVAIHPGYMPVCFPTSSVLIFAYVALDRPAWLFWVVLSFLVFLCVMAISCIIDANKGRLMDFDPVVETKSENGEFETISRDEMKERLTAGASRIQDGICPNGCAIMVPFAGGKECKVCDTRVWKSSS